ncbi:MAG: phytoene desaturase family protein, partial [Candidatus Brocadiia bacterium]
MGEHSIAVIGAGPGGLTAAMILAHNGLNVTVFEKKDRVGGRNAPLHLGDFTFDTGPTFLMMKGVLEEVFKMAGTDPSDHLNLMPVDPLYRLKFPDVEFCPRSDPQKTREAIAETFPGNESGFDRFLETESRRYRSLLPCLKRDYSSLTSYLNATFLSALPRMSLGRSVFGNLGRYFDDERLKLCFSFQSKYLGMSPWDCPAFFTMLAYIEHAQGIYHVRGGLNRISTAMADVARENGADIRLESPVERISVSDGRATGVVLPDGKELDFDRVVINADFGHAVNTLLPADCLRRYSPDKLENWNLSCSTFMLYLGVDRTYTDLPHHNVIFAEDYQRNVDEVMETGCLPADPSFYVQNASVSDPTLAPEGQSTIYVLVPVPNTRADVDWDPITDEYADTVIGLVEERGGVEGLRENIVRKKVITPADWTDKYDVYRGATFNLAHTLFQLLYFRPHNRFEEIGNCYLVGGGTHPGSGLPTIYESGRISSELVLEDLSGQK